MRADRVGGRTGAHDAIPLVLTACIWVAVVAWLLSSGRTGDLDRFVQIAHGGTPYVDQQVEYPPLETLLIAAIGGGTVSLAIVLTALINAAATIVSWLLIRDHWSADAGRLFLWFSLPLQVFMPVRLDAVAVALTIGGVILADRGRGSASGVMFAAAILFRLWPLALLPLLWLKGRRRGVGVCLLVVTIGLVVWVAAFGTDAPRQVATFRGALGWQIETPVGIVLLARAGGSFIQDAGAARVGQMLAWQTWALGAATCVAVAIAWSLARRRHVDLAGGPALAAVASILVLSPVASPQYVAWLLPWAAITASERRSLDVRIATVAAGVTAAGIFAAYWGSRFQLSGFVVMVGTRIAAITGLAVIGFTHRTVGRSDLVIDAGEGGSGADDSVLTG